jgi:hypothetical protein
MTKPATDVFLSYKAEDRTRLQPLVEALEADGITVWWDAHISMRLIALALLLAFTSNSISAAGEPEGSFT